MKLINIHKVYHNKNNTVEALKGIDLEINEKGLIVLLGSSGCGKTTLLNIISGEDKAFEGERTAVPEMDYLTQDFNLFESMSVLDNLLLVKDDIELIEKYLKQFEMLEHKDKKVKKCSNGQKKRIQFIRALLHKPGLLLCDEPTAALDHENAEVLMQHLKEASKEIQVILVTHDIALAEKYADRIIRLDQGMIVSDEIRTVHEQANEGIAIPKKTLKETYQLVIKEMKSRIGENIIMIVMTCFAVLAIFTTFNLYQTIESQTEYLSQFRTAKNLVLSYPKDMTKYLKFEDDIQDAYYINFDKYQLKDIQKVISANKDIMAVEAYYDDNVYQMNILEDAMDAFLCEEVFKSYEIGEKIQR